MNDKLKYMKDKICNLSDDNLLRMVNVDSANYRQEAITVAKEELIRRDIAVISESKIEELRKKADREISVEWLNFYIYGRLPLSIAGALINSLLAGDQVVIFGTALYSISLLILLIGFRKRRLWAWKLNWLLLVFEALSFPLRVQYGFYFGWVALVVLVWVWPNYVYFKKRRHLFLSRHVKQDQQS